VLSLEPTPGRRRKGIGKSGPLHRRFRNSTLTWVLFSYVSHDKSASISDSSFGGRGILSRGYRSRFHRPLCGCLARRPGRLAHPLAGHGPLCWCFFSLGMAFQPLLRWSGQDMSQSPPTRSSPKSGYFRIAHNSLGTQFPEWKESASSVRLAVLSVRIGANTGRLPQGYN
jgi:hypothetical protein